jgi:hypothetical protein
MGHRPGGSFFSWPWRLKPTIDRSIDMIEQHEWLERSSFSLSPSFGVVGAPSINHFDWLSRIVGEGGFL